MKPVPSIRSWLALLVAVCLLPASLISVGLLIYDYQQSKEQLLENLATTSETISALVDKHFANVTGILHAMATSPSLANNDLAAFYRQAKILLPAQNVSNIVLTDPQGKQILNTLRPFGERLPENGSSIRMDHFGTSNNPIISDLFFGKVAKRPVIAVAVPVRKNGAAVYGLSTGMSPEPFENLLRSQRFPASWNIIILDGKGSIVAHSSGISQDIGKRASQPLLDALADRSEGMVKMEGADQPAMVTVFKRSSATNWTVAISIPNKGLYRELYKAISGLIVAITLLFAFSLAVAKMLSRRIASSIRSLTAPAIALGEGKAVHVPSLRLAEADEVGKALRKASDMLELARYQATHDMLTGLANRTLFYEIVNSQLRLAIRNASHLSVLYIDLDGFKPVNDTYGHAAGDKLLCHVADRLRAVIRKSDVGARLGGDEFAVVLVGSDPTNSGRVAEKILSALTNPCILDGVEIRISASIGIASFPQAGTDLRTMLHAADEAMYRAKAAGKNRIIAAQAISVI